MGGEGTGDGTTALLVDDNAAYLAIAARQLGTRMRVVTATSAASAREAVRSRAPQLAIVDLRLPDGSGIDLIQHLRTVHPAIKIALLSGYLSIPIVEDAVRAGANLVVPKPTPPRQVLAMLDRPNARPRLREARGSAPMTLARVEWEYIQRLLAECDNNLSTTATALGIHRTTLQRKLRRKPPA